MDSAIRLPAFLFFGVAAILALSAIFGGGGPTPAAGSEEEVRGDLALDELREEPRWSRDRSTRTFAARSGREYDDIGGFRTIGDADASDPTASASTSALDPIPEDPRGFLAANHDLILPPPNPTIHEWSWEDDRTQLVFERCKPVARDPQAPKDAFAVRAVIDFDALDAIEEHFGFLPDDVFTLHRADGDQRDYSIDSVTAPAYRLALAKHGVLLETDKIRPDFGWLTSRTAPHLRRLAEAIVENWRAKATPASQGGGAARPGNGPMHDLRVEALTSFVQRAIRYESIPATEGAVERCGLRSPGPTLLRGGDCDSKAVLLAALIRAVDRQMPLVMVSVTVKDRPHVLLGVGIPAEPCSAILDYQGTRYVLIEVTSSLGVGLMAPDYNEATFDHYAIIP